MKKIFYNTFVQLILALFVFGFAACQEFEIDSQTEQPLNIQIDALDSYTAMATSPSNVVFNISSNTPWSIQSDQQWCKVTPSMSAISSLVSEIVVSMEDNTTTKSRVATLTISAENISETKVVTINQVSKENLVVIPYDGLVDSEGEAISFAIISNKPWEIIPSTAFLSNIDKKNGMGNENGTEEIVIITVPGNPGARRSGTLTVKTEFDEYTFEIAQNGVVIEMEDNPEGIITFDGGYGNDLVSSTVVIRANNEWKVEVPDEYQDWLFAEAISDTELKVSVKANNRLTARTGKLIMKTKELIDGFDGVEFTVKQNSLFSLNVSGYEVDEETGNVKVMMTQGEMIRSSFKTYKGRTTIEFADMHMTAIYNWGVNFTSTDASAGSANYKLHAESGNTYWFRCAGGFSWVAPIKKTFTFDELNAIRKLDFVVEDDSENVGKVKISIFINDELYGTQKGRTDIYANGAGTPILIEAGKAPADGDYMVIKSITYTPNE